MKSARQHLDESEMDYWYHLRHSFANGLHLFGLAITSFVHAIFPQIWPQRTAQGVIKIYNGMRQHRHLRRLQEQLKNS